MDRLNSHLPDFLKRIIRRDRYYPVIAMGIVVLFLLYDALSFRDGRVFINELDSIIILITLSILGIIFLVYKKRSDARMRALLKQRRLYGSYDDMREKARSGEQTSMEK